MDQAAQRSGGVQQAAPRARNTHIDVLRGMAMIFVIMIHMPTQEYFGYSFLMVLYNAVPLYFLVSGYLLSSSARKTGFGAFLGRRALTLLVPYTLFFALSFLWTQTAVAYSTGGPLFGFSVNWTDMLYAYAFAGQYLFNIALVAPPLWFLHALFFVSVLYYAIARIRSKIAVSTICVVLVVGTLPLQSLLANNPIWLLRLLPAALFFMAFGHLLRLAFETLEGMATAEGQAKRGKRKTWDGLLHSFLGAVLILASFRLMQLGRGSMWEITSAWYFLGALVFALGCFLFARESNNRILLFAGRNSLYYLGLHGLLLRLPFVEALPNQFVAMGFDGISIYLCYFIVTFLGISIMVQLALWVVELIRRPFRGRTPRRKKVKYLPDAEKESIALEEIGPAADDSPKEDKA